jgi:hypothetical protein
MLPVSDEKMMTARKEFLGFLLCSWARPVPYHRTKGLKSIEFFGDMKRRREAVDPA